MEITVEYLREFFELDPEAGTLKFAVRPRSHFASDAACKLWNRRHAGKSAGGRSAGGYLFCKIFERIFRVHRIVFALYHGRMPVLAIDHIDRNKVNNRPSNLRECTIAENSRNACWRNPHGFKGVSIQNSRFVASIRVNRKKMHLGRFDTAEEAHQAYRKAAIEHHGEFANFDIKEGPAK